MKKLIRVLWGIFAIAILGFGVAVFTVHSDVTLWTLFSIAMPVAGISFWGAIILTIIDFVRSNQK